MIDTPKQLFIGGTWTDASDGATMPVDDPAAGEVVCHVADAGQKDALLAEEAAVRAQGEWAATAPRARSEIARRAHELTTAVTGPSVWGAACAVCLVAWTPYAVHAAALFEQERATGHVQASRSLGAGPVHLTRHSLLPAVLPAVLRNAVLRLPTTVLVLASLGFLGLGEQPPTPEWGRLLSENQPYLELAPWTVLGPAAALVLLSVLAVSSTAVGRKYS